jgi:hypothetical protein
MSRIPRALVEGKIEGPLSPAMYALWVWAIGRGIDEMSSRQRHIENYGVVFPISASDRGRITKIIALLHSRV